MKAQPEDIKVVGYASLEAFKNWEHKPIVALDPIFSWDEAIENANQYLEKYPIIVISNLQRITILTNPELGLTLRDIFKLQEILEKRR